MKPCFNHESSEFEKTCPLCSKDFCEYCLLLVGKRQTLICTNCYSHIIRKIKNSTKRRYILILGGIIILAPTLMQAPDFLSSGNSDAALFFIFSLVIILTTALNIVRLVQYRSWNIIQKYSRTKKDLK